MTPDLQVERNRLGARLDRAVSALTDRPTPIAVVDLDAFDANADDLARRASGTPIRVASKSLRVPALIERALAHPGFAGVLAFTLREALWLHAEGVSDDLLVAYPSVDRAALARLTRDPAAAACITVMVDDVAHLDLLDASRTGDAEVRVALDVDAALLLAGAHVGPRRSPLHDVDDVVALARTVAARRGVRLVGVMSYEGQVAGLPDSLPTQRARSAVVRRIKSASVRQLARRRSAIVEALAPVADLEFWNAGGSGSLETSAADGAVTELAAGSGLLVPGLFDHYRAFSPRPAAFFGLPVTRRPSEGVVTVHGGGLVASGPPGADRAPLPWAPAGLTLTAAEGAGEVQTPLAGHPASSLAIGDLVWFRHAKSGELFEHVRTTHLLSGDSLVGEVPSYRGAGQAF